MRGSKSFLLVLSRFNSSFALSEPVQMAPPELETLLERMDPERGGDAGCWGKSLAPANCAFDVYCCLSVMMPRGVDAGGWPCCVLCLLSGDAWDLLVPDRLSGLMASFPTQSSFLVPSLPLFPVCSVTFASPLHLLSKKTLMSRKIFRPFLCP